MAFGAGVLEPQVDRNDMPVHVLSSGESFFAYVALDGGRFMAESLMRIQVALVVEPLLANVAPERLFKGVSQQMEAALMNSLEHLGAEVAPICRSAPGLLFLFGQVDEGVKSHGMFPCKGFAAMFALVSTSSFVHIHVVLVLLLSGEYFETDGALEGGVAK